MYKILVAAAILSISSAAWAQRQPTSCSGGAQACKETIGRVRSGTPVTPSQCEAAAAQCMKTGVFVGPGSGTRWPVEKKQQIKFTPSHPRRQHARAKCGRTPAGDLTCDFSEAPLLL
jgi:hypothetical protein